MKDADPPRSLEVIDGGAPDDVQAGSVGSARDEPGAGDERGAHDDRSPRDERGGREALVPELGPRRDLPERVACPFCGGRDTLPVATFGSLLMTAQYSCRGCHSTFEWVRREGD